MMKYDLPEFSNNTQSVNEPLSEPHFDDEATLLSARRVIPFHKLSEDKNSKRHLFFGATVAAALVMGVIGGVIYARFDGTPAPKTETTKQAAQPSLQDEFVSSSAQSDQSVLNDKSADRSDESKTLAEDNGNQKIADKPRNPATNVRKGVTLNPTPAKQVQTEPDEWEYYERERERRRAERREARRAKRQAERETQQSDDLFRIRDIFEGSSRP